MTAAPPASAAQTLLLPKSRGRCLHCRVRDEALAPRTKSLVRRSRSHPPSAAPACGRSVSRSGIPLHDAGLGGERRARRADSTGYAQDPLGFGDGGSRLGDFRLLRLDPELLRPEPEVLHYDDQRRPPVHD